MGDRMKLVSHRNRLFQLAIQAVHVSQHRLNSLQPAKIVSFRAREKGRKKQKKRTRGEERTYFGDVLDESIAFALKKTSFYLLVCLHCEPTCKRCNTDKEV